MPDNVNNEVMDLMQDLYFDGPNARALLIGIGYRPAQIPEFRSGATFWPDVVLRLSSGIVANGIGRLLAAAVRDHPGNAQAAELLAKVAGPAGPVAVLCLFADPLRGSKIRIDREARLLGEINDLAGVAVTMRHAVRVTDILNAVIHGQPRILHFGGHGTADGRLVFEDDRGGAARVGLENMARAIKAVTAKPLDCVVLNSCFTGANAEAFRGATAAVAGSTTAIRDDCALAFARGFYTAVNAGLAVPKAYDAGHAEAGLAGCDTSGLHFVSFAGSPA
ncbi:effector-associated domain EAD1-containing protein [Actinocrispum wychmicini]|uniref:CHAT domain-containing protein n=1 Tax=Actinocrispum wychmicini TaxID=1213861 RepID=A0A4R2J8M0_9PSEU|nr:effector-associated domain EAD1-containing protein [Actinocrispum wychmicini]TCO52878.1 CHAT domain-containing protein [Actinocrispum wychmicini]